MDEPASEDVLDGVVLVLDGDVEVESLEEPFDGFAEEEVLRQHYQGGAGRFVAVEVAVVDGAVDAEGLFVGVEAEGAVVDDGFGEEEAGGVVTGLVGDFGEENGRKEDGQK